MRNQIFTQTPTDFYTSREEFLLSESNKVGQAFNVSLSNGLANLARCNVTLEDNDAALGLKSRSHKGAGLVEGEVARIVSTSSDGLDVGRLTSGGVNGVRDKGIRLDGGSVGERELLGVLETG